jgi:hypothetical protein
MGLPASPHDRQELHNPSVDEQVAEVGACGQVHLQTGRTCTLDRGHEGSCNFIPRDRIDDTLTQQRVLDES